MRTRSKRGLWLAAAAVWFAPAACGLDEVVPLSVANGSSGSSGSDGRSPVPQDDVFFGRQDESLIIGSDDGLLANDVSGARDILHAVAETVTSEAGATVTIEIGGGFQYEPLPGSWGVDHFAYQAVDDDANGRIAEATVHVAPGVIPLREVQQGVGGLAIDGAHGADFCGTSVAGIGDVDGDGMPDVAVGLGVWTGPGATVGYILTGVAGNETIDLGASSPNVFAIADLPVIARLEGVVAAGDFDGDGRNDVLAWTYLGVGLVLGAELAPTVDFSTTHVDRWASSLSQECPGEVLVLGADGAGDFDGDGQDDLLLATGPDQSGACVGIVFYGDEIDGSVCDAPYRPLALPGDSSLFPAIGAGDIDGDGRDDVVFGLPGPGTHALVASLAGIGFEIHRSGTIKARSVAAAGDVNGDDLDDLVIGVPEGIINGVTAGIAYVVYGKADQAPVDLAALGDGGFAIYGEAEGDALGEAVSAAGDVNGDGYADVLVGAPEFGGDPPSEIPPMGSPPAWSTGRAYVIYGGPTPRYIAVAELGAAGFVIDSEPGKNKTGATLSAAGDINGDGVDDVLVGAPVADPRGRVDAGRTYVVYGTRTAPAPVSP